MNQAHDQPIMEVKRIGILLHEGADLLDVAGAAGVFHCAGRHFVWIGASDRVTYQIDYLSPDGGLLSTWQGLSVETRALAEVDPLAYHTVIVVGGLWHENCPDSMIDWLRGCRGIVPRISSVCIGAYLLARAGLLDGHRAATHWEDCRDLAARFPNIEVDPDAIFVEDRGIWTGAGVTAGIDMALAMVEQDHGHDLALLVARRLVVFLKRPGGQSQFSSQLECQKGEGPLAPLLQWIVENPTADLRAEALAARANMSLRNFYRAFVSATGSSPADWVEGARLEVAKRLLEQTGHRFDQVARESGFGGYERMRRSFARRLGIAPSDYRERFSRPLQRLEKTIDLSSLSDIYPTVSGMTTIQ